MEGFRSEDAVREDASASQKHSRAPCKKNPPRSPFGKRGRIGGCVLTRGFARGFVRRCAALGGGRMERPAEPRSEVEQCASIGLPFLKGGLEGFPPPFPKGRFGGIQKRIRPVSRSYSGMEPEPRTNRASPAPIPVVLSPPSRPPSGAGRLGGIGPDGRFRSAEPGGRV